MKPSALKKRSETTKKYYSNKEEGGNIERISHSPVRFKADGGQGTVDAYQRIMGAQTAENKQEKRGYQPDGIQRTVDAYQRLRVKDSAA